MFNYLLLCFMKNSKNFQTKISKKWTKILAPVWPFLIEKKFWKINMIVDVENWH